MSIAIGMIGACLLGIAIYMLDTNQGPGTRVILAGCSVAGGVMIFVASVMG